MAKQKTISLAYARLGNTYEVQAITNSVILHPGDWINPQYAKVLCDNPEWEVSITTLHLSMPINPANIISIIPAL